MSLLGLASWWVCNESLARVSAEWQLADIGEEVDIICGKSWEFASFAKNLLQCNKKKDLINESTFDCWLIRHHWNETDQVPACSWHDNHRGCDSIPIWYRTLYKQLVHRASKLDTCYLFVSWIQECYSRNVKPSPLTTITTCYWYYIILIIIQISYYTFLPVL